MFRLVRLKLSFRFRLKWIRLKIRFGLMLRNRLLVSFRLTARFRHCLKFRLKLINSLRLLL